MPKRILDSHHHLWDYDAQQYPWIPPGSPLEDDHGLDDLATLTADLGVEASVAVQARQTIEETDWLLSLAEAHPLCKAVVGWVPLQDDNIAEVLASYADKPLVKGVRHVIQDEEDPRFMLRPAFLRGLEALSKTLLRYDILIFGHQLPNTIKMVDALPDAMPLVLDHIAKPAIEPDKFDKPWACAMAELAKRPNVVCKLSGVVTEVRGDTLDVETVRPYVQHAFDTFGPGRMMYGSDWPVCLLKSSYADWVSMVERFICALSPDEQDAVLYRNAAAFYGID